MTDARAGERERKALTKRAIDAARYTGNGRSQCMVWDSTLPGFGLRIHPSGRKAFVLHFRTIDGAKRLHTIGRYPEITLDQARRKAKTRIAEVLDGRDPSAERRDRRHARSFGEIADLYLERHARVHKRSARDDEQRIRDFLRPAWGSRKAHTIVRADVSAVHRKIGQEKPYAANRTLALASHIFSWAEINGYLPEGHPNPARGVRKFQETARERWLSTGEVRRLLEALRTEPNLYVQAFFWLALLTGCRKKELLGARWEDVDSERGLLRLPETKAGRVHMVPLSGPASELLDRLPREAGNPFVFPGSRAGKPLVNVEKCWRRVRGVAGCPDARLHDLRRTVGSWMAQDGISLHVIGSVLNHTNASTTSIYARLTEDNRRNALEGQGEAIRRLAAVPGEGGR